MVTEVRRLIEVTQNRLARVTRRLVPKKTMPWDRKTAHEYAESGNYRAQGVQVPHVFPSSPCVHVTCKPHLPRLPAHHRTLPGSRPGLRHWGSFHRERRALAPPTAGHWHAQKLSRGAHKRGGSCHYSTVVCATGHPREETTRTPQKNQEERGKRGTHHVVLVQLAIACARRRERANIQAVQGLARHSKRGCPASKTSDEVEVCYNFSQEAYSASRGAPPNP